MYPYAGDANEGINWRNTVRGYSISRNEVLVPIPECAGTHELKEVTLANMATECDDQGRVIDDLARLGDVVWPQRLPRAQC